MVPLKTTNQKTDMQEFIVAEKRCGITVAAMSGCGRNRGTWDACAKSKRTAYRWLKELRNKYPARTFAVETAN